MKSQNNIISLAQVKARRRNQPAAIGNKVQPAKPQSDYLRRKAVTAKTGGNFRG